MPNYSRVIEFGAARRALEKYLDPSCVYTASDLVDRGLGTIVCDLNERPLPDLGADAYDVAVLMGVLEYVRDMPSVIDWLAQHFSSLRAVLRMRQGQRPSGAWQFENIGRLNKGG